MRRGREVPPFRWPTQPRRLHDNGAMRFALKRGPERLSLQVAGREVPVAVKRNARARRLILRIDAASGLPVVTLPMRASLAQGEAFLHKHVPWLETRLGRAPGLPFCDGAEFP